jgi:hypothetical protein
MLRSRDYGQLGRPSCSEYGLNIFAPGLAKALNQHHYMNVATINNWRNPCAN